MHGLFGRWLSASVWLAALYGVGFAALRLVVWIGKKRIGKVALFKASTVDGLHIGGHLLAANDCGIYVVAPVPALHGGGMCCVYNALHIRFNVGGLRSLSANNSNTNNSNAGALLYALRLFAMRCIYGRICCALLFARSTG